MIAKNESAADLNTSVQKELEAILAADDEGDIVDDLSFNRHFSYGTTKPANDHSGDGSDKSSCCCAALSYAGMGHAVLPLRPRDKRPATRHGHKDAAKVADTISTWWSDMPDANVGIRTGDIVVIDVDPVDDGQNPWLATANGKACLEQSNCVARTGRGGLHLYFQNKAQLRNSVGRIAPGVDVRGVGGYIVAPPSIHANGKAYSWEKGSLEELTVSDLTPLPACIVKALTSQKATPTSTKSTLSKGKRNDGLFKLACQALRGGVSSDEINDWLMKKNLSLCSPPLGEDEVFKIAASAQKRAFDKNFVEDSVQRLGIFPLTDFGNAERFVNAANGLIRWNSTSKEFFHYSGTHWEPDPALTQAHAKEVIRSIVNLEATSVRCSTLTDDAQDAILNSLCAHAKASEAEPRIKAMLKLASNEPGMQFCSSELDLDPFLLNVKNGTIDLKSGTLRNHDPADLFSYCLSTEFQPHAKAPRWERFITEICCGDAELAGLLQRLVGYFLTGSVEEQVLITAWGTGGNGKSLFFRMVMEMLGQLAIKAEAAIFASNFKVSQPGRASPEIARMRGRRLVVSDELEGGTHINEAAVKNQTGDDLITARDLFSRNFDFNPTHKVVLIGNARPAVHGSDHGIWRRLLLVPFNATFSDQIGNCDKGLKRKLLAELPGILTWAVQGCLQWQRQGLDIPEAVKAATREFREETDVLARFLADTCYSGKEYRASSAEIHREYKKWAERVGEKPLSKRILGMRLREAGFKSDKSAGGRGWIGLELRVRTP